MTKSEKLLFKCVKKQLCPPVVEWILGLFSNSGSLIWLHGKLNAEVYKNIIEQYMVPSLRASPILRPIFIQNNIPCSDQIQFRMFGKSSF